MSLIRNTKGTISPNWDISEMHSQIADLFAVKAKVYWFDFLTSAIIGWLFLYICFRVEIFSVYFWVYLLISSFALYRALSFIHELAHLRKNTVPGFQVVWLMLIGIPLMLPTFFYEGIHATHHQKNKDGTLLDGEYMPFASAPIGLIIGNFLSHLVLPIFFVVRFGVLGPISFLHPKLRKMVLENLSGFTIRFPFKRELYSRPQEKTLWFYEEVATIAFLWIILLSVFFGFLPPKLFLLYYLIVYLVATLNSIRTIGATHRYRSHGNEISFQQQYKDSVNVNSSRLDSLLLCPVGLRFHALHHLFPGLPYHALATAHLRLSEVLPASADYHQSNLDSVWQGWAKLRIRKSPSKNLKPRLYPRYLLLPMLIIGLGVPLLMIKNSHPTSDNISAAINTPLVIDIVGSVYNELNGTKQKIALGMRINMGDILETDYRSFIKIQTPAKSLITLNQNSKLFWSQNSLHLKEGNLFAEVKKKDIPSVYHLTAPDGSNIAITGTAFEWSYQPKSSNAELKVKEGVVEFYKGTEKKITLQNQALSAGEFNKGAQSIAENSIAPWLKSYELIKNGNTYFIDSFSDVKFNSYWVFLATQKNNQSSPQKGLVCLGKDQKVELSSQEFLLNNVDPIMVSFSSGAIIAKGDFEYGYEIWDENKLIVNQGISVSQINAEEFSIKEKCNISNSKDLGKTNGKSGKLPDISFDLTLAPAKEYIMNKVDYQTGEILSDIKMNSSLNKFRIVFYLKTFSEKSKATWRIKCFGIGVDNELNRSNFKNAFSKTK